MFTKICLFGWLVPLIPVLAWLACYIYHAEGSAWYVVAILKPELRSLAWFYDIPILLFLIIDMVLFSKIMSILVEKIKVERGQTGQNIKLASLVKKKKNNKNQLQKKPSKMDRLTFSHFRDKHRTKSELTTLKDDESDVMSLREEQELGNRFRRMSQEGPNGPNRGKRLSVSGGYGNNDLPSPAAQPRGTRTSIIQINFNKDCNLGPCRKRFSINKGALTTSPLYRLAKATFLLVFLFGLHSVLFKVVALFIKESGDFSRKAEDISEGVSGFIVSIAYCYSNNEVLAVIKEKINRWKRGY